MQKNDHRKKNKTNMLLYAVTISLLMPLLAVDAQTSEQNCPEWNEWQAWSKCLWGNFEDGKVKIFDAFRFALEQWPALPSPMADAGQCGHCPWRTRIRKRPLRHGCSFFDIDWEQCDDAIYAPICTYSLNEEVFNDPVVRKLRCTAIELSKTFLRQCGAQTAADGWLRHVNNDIWDKTPVFNCVERGGKCHCCCGAFEPSADAARCVRKPEERCAEWGEFNEWSDKCMWFNSPPEGMLAGVTEHCAVDPAHIDHPVVKSLLSPPNVAEAELPERCGYCSFRAKCRSRPPFSASTGAKSCFPLDVEKRACGPQDCAGCGRPCHLPRVEGGCGYANMILNVAEGQRRAVDELPAAMRGGLLKLLTNLPFGKCVEIEGQCKCCCHPYEPTADGQSCQLAEPCRWPQPDTIDAYDALQLPRNEL